MDWKTHILALCAKDEIPAKPTDECSHDDVVEELDNTICSDCGEIVNRKLTTENSFSQKSMRRRPAHCPVFADVPDDFDSDVKNLAVIIYKTATVRRIYRSTLRKSIIAACLYRASVILNKPIRKCFTVFGLTNTEANRGVVFVATNLPYGEYTISMFGDKSEICAACSIVGITGDDVEHVFRLFESVKHGCNGIMASSQRISIIYGCIWIFIQTFPSKSYPGTISELIDLLINETCGEKKKGMLPVSAVTINKKFNEITKFVLTRIMKRVFATCISLVCTADQLVSKTPNIPVTLYDCTDPDKITMVADDGFVYPLEDVDDVNDWNILFDMVYNTKLGEKVCMPIKLESKPKAITVSFVECPILLAEVGQLILKSEMKRFIKNM